MVVVFRLCAVCTAKQHPFDEITDHGATSPPRRTHADAARQAEHERV
jgi:hypothetical protein